VGKYLHHKLNVFDINGGPGWRRQTVQKWPNMWLTD